MLCSVCREKLLLLEKEPEYERPGRGSSCSSCPAPRLSGPMTATLAPTSMCVCVCACVPLCVCWREWVVQIWAVGLGPAYQPCCGPFTLGCSTGYFSVCFRTIMTVRVKPTSAKTSALCVCPFLILLG